MAMKEETLAGALLMKSHKELVGLSRRYLDAFKNKNLDVLKSMFSNDVELIDWENNIVGFDDVVSFNQDVFSAHKSINIQIKSIKSFPDSLTTQCKILITLVQKDKQTLSVIDVLTFDDNGLIKKIQAEKIK